MIKEAIFTTSFVLLAMILGSIVGLTNQSVEIIGNYVDYLILILIFLVFLDSPIEKILLAFQQPKTLLIAWLTNFAILPFLGFGLTKLFLNDQPLIAIGLAIYFMSPCTDWFLGFTRMANGNTSLGSVLLPINMLTQLLLYPFFIHWFSYETITAISASEIIHTLTDWFVIPIVAAFVAKLFINKIDIIKNNLGLLTNLTIYALVFAIFSTNVQQIVDNYLIFELVLITVIVFFVISLLFTETITKLFKLTHENHILYTMTTTARNAPLMLGLTMSALPNQPLIYAALIIGMLIEFPYLAFLASRFNTDNKASHQITQGDATLSMS